MFFTGSWYLQDAAVNMITWMKTNGFDIILDWTSAEHHAKSRFEQRNAILEAIRDADVFVCNLTGYEDRLVSASFLQCAITDANRTPMVIIDPLRDTRERPILSREIPDRVPTHHPAFMNVMGSFLTDPDGMCVVLKHTHSLAEIIQIQAKK